MPSSSPTPQPNWPTMNLMFSSPLLEVNSSLKVSDPFFQRSYLRLLLCLSRLYHAPHSLADTYYPHLPPLLGFTVREMRGKLAIGITVNFVNGRTVEETQVPEISGVARIYNQSFFQSLLKATGQDPFSRISPPSS